MRISVFAGTAEGRDLSQYLSQNGIFVTAFVATQYGKLTLPEQERLRVCEGRLDAAKMAEAIAGTDAVVDATHPYADKVTENIKKACKICGAAYYRLYRPSETVKEAIYVPDTGHAAEYLKHTEGNVLITTGSKELQVFTRIPNYKDRLYVRVLPSPESLDKGIQLGFCGKHLICMQGPFSHALNAALLRQLDIRYLVTKDTGAAGGFREKISAACETGTKALIIARPTEESGYSLQQLKELFTGKTDSVPSSHFELRVNSEEADEKNDKPKSKEVRFPLFISLTDKKVLMVGGGKIACRRVRVLVRFGAAVQVVAPTLCEELQAFVKSGRITYFKRGYCREDLEGCALAVAAANERSVNRAVGKDAKKKNIPVSVADSRDESSFYFPAVFENDELTGGLISKEGSNHKLVKKTAEHIRSIL